MTNNNAPYGYGAVNFGTCSSCHSSDPAGNFSFSEAWSEASTYTPFDSYCSTWNTNGNRFYYGARRAGCVLYLVDIGTMPQGSPGGWSFDTNYLQWYCSGSGPGGEVFGW